MATKETVTLQCDPCGSKADKADLVVTRHFSVDGQSYETDVCTGHEAEFDRMMDRFIACSRKSTPQQRKGLRTTEDRERAAKVRAFWRKHPELGGDPDAHGRIPSRVLEAYNRK